MYWFWNACNLRFNICAGDWKNDSVEANGYAIDLSIGVLSIPILWLIYIHVPKASLLH